MLETPILYLVFNRPDLVKITFEQICLQKPKHLYIAADGPRERVDNEEKKCKEVRNYILDRIDWDCHVQTLFRESNLGCKVAVSSAIDWFFENVEEGIILEDDILPHPDFFYFASELLKRYETDHRIMMITGLNINTEWKSKYQDYHFAKFGGIWGWASWRRAWQLYDVDIKLWSDAKAKRRILENFPKEYRARREKLYDSLFLGNINTWDLQWTFAKLMNSGFNIIPAKNLIKNIGCTDGGTHIQEDHPWANLETTGLRPPYRANIRIENDIEYDLFHLSFEKTNAKENKTEIEILFRKIISKTNRLLR